jgi:Na+/H+ antiporter NhaC
VLFHTGIGLRVLVPSRLLGLFLLFLALVGARLYAGEVRVPSVALAGVPFEVAVSGFAPLTAVQIRFEDAQGRLLARADAVADESGAASMRARISQTGAARYVWQAGTASGDGTVRVIPAWWSLLPPLLAIALALLLRQVVLALLGGVWLGAWLIAGGEPFTPLLRVVDTYLLDAYADRDHLQIVLFTLLLGGMLGIITRAGGLRAIVRALSRRVRSDRGVQLSAYLLGLLIFIDDYANTLFVGATMRPLADRYRVSREKLAYLIDSTAAPVANLALVGTWIGFEVSVIADSFKAAGIALEPYWAFLLSLPYRFYPIFALAFIAWLLVWRRDFGAMYRAEARARTTGKVLADGASPLANYDSAELMPPDHLRGSLWSAVLPILTALVGAVGGLFYTGYYGALEAGDPITLRAVLANANSYISLVWGALLGCIMALLCVWLTRALSLRESFEAWVGGVRSMVLAVVILGLAWSIGAVCETLHTAQYLVQSLQGAISPAWLPALTTLTAAGISFAIGSSWGTMSILMPLAVPLAHSLTVGMDAEAQQFYLIATISSVLAGGGDFWRPLLADFGHDSALFHFRGFRPYRPCAHAVAVCAGGGGGSVGGGRCGDGVRAACVGGAGDWHSLAGCDRALGWQADASVHRRHGGRRGVGGYPPSLGSSLRRGAGTAGLSVHPWRGRAMAVARRTPLRRLDRFEGVVVDFASVGFGLDALVHAVFHRRASTACHASAAPPRMPASSIRSAGTTRQSSSRVGSA